MNYYYTELSGCNVQYVKWTLGLLLFPALGHWCVLIECCFRPKLCNSVPSSVLSDGSLVSVKSKHKPHLFVTYVGWLLVSVTYQISTGLLNWIYCFWQRIVVFFLQWIKTSDNKLEFWQWIRIFDIILNYWQ